MILYVLRNTVGEYVTVNGYLSPDKGSAEIFTTYEEARQKMIVLLAINDEYYHGIYPDTY